MLTKIDFSVQSMPWKEGFFLSLRNPRDTLEEYLELLDPKYVEEFSHGWNCARSLYESHRKDINRA